MAKRNSCQGQKQLMLHNEHVVLGNAGIHHGDLNARRTWGTGGVLHGSALAERGKLYMIPLSYEFNPSLSS